MLNVYSILLRFSLIDLHLEVLLTNLLLVTVEFSIRAALCLFCEFVTQLVVSTIQLVGNLEVYTIL